MRTVPPVGWRKPVHLAIVNGTIAQRPWRWQTARHQLGCARFVTWCRSDVPVATVTATELVTLDLNFQCSVPVKQRTCSSTRLLRDEGILAPYSPA